MKTILMTAYAVDPYKGSEEGTGWNLVNQAARYHKVIAITRKNNRAPIEKYIAEQGGGDPRYDRIEFRYYDWPRWLIFWKKGPLLSALYFYCWQMGVALWLLRVRPVFNLAHSVNFHSNWTPSFLWILGKPFVWGPVGHHPLIPRQYIFGQYGAKAYFKDRMLGMVKWIFWHLDPFLYLSRKMAQKVFVVNSEAGTKLRLKDSQKLFMPAVASEPPANNEVISAAQFTVLSVGRFVPLKGFDLAIRSFAKFYHRIDPMQRASSRMVIIGKGPEKEKLERMINELGMEGIIEIREWMPRADVIDMFRHASVFLFPSHEGAGMVVAEALSYGLPVIALNNPGPGEYIHPDSSMCVDHQGYVETVQALANKLNRLYQDPSVYAEESRLARERYAQLFRWEIKGDKMKEVYENLMVETSTTEIVLTTIKSA